MRRIALGLLLSAALPASAFAVGTCPELAVVNARIRNVETLIPDFDAETPAAAPAAVQDV